MDDTLIKQPTHFPVDGDVTPKIDKNEKNVYSFNYNANSDKVSTFSGNRYESSEAVSDKLGEFMDGKKNNPSKERESQILDTVLRAMEKGLRGMPTLAGKREIG